MGINSRMFAAAIGLAGLLFAAAGLVAWWARHTGVFAMPFADLLPMALASVCLLLASTALLLPSTRTWTRPLRIALGVAIVALAVLGALWDVLFPTRSLHQFMFPNSPTQAGLLQSGMAPNATLAFALYGSALLLAAREGAHWTAGLLRFLLLGLSALGTLDFIGYLIPYHLPDWYTHARMPVATAAGMMLLAAGSWVVVSHSDWYRRFFDTSEDWHIALTSGAVLLVVALVSGLTGFGLMSATTERVLMDSLRISLENRARTIQDALAYGVELTTHIDSHMQTDIAEQPAHEGTRYDGRSQLVHLLTEVEKFSGVSGVELLDKSGKAIDARGQFVREAELRLPLGGISDTALLWHGRPILERRLRIVQAGRTIGSITVQVPLPSLQGLSGNLTGPGDSGLVAVCAPLGNERMQCLPNRTSSGRATVVTRLPGGNPTAMDRALRGEQGFMRVYDEQGQDALVAYAPIGPLNLGMTVRVRISELYAPIRARMYHTLLGLFLVTFAGMLLLRWRLMPLVRELMHEIDERREAEMQLRHLTEHDTLTGLPNRTHLLSRLQQALTEADRHQRLAAVMLLDLDGFKHINDTLGHAAGDDLLKEAAERLAHGVRPGDTVARLGGDEFAVVLSNVAHVDHVAGVAQKLLDLLAQPFRLGGRMLYVTASIGITLYPLDESDAEGLLKNADAAMYHAKERGRNAFQYYTAELNMRAERRLKVETALRTAIERNELRLHYQPQVDMKSGRITGMEALARWTHPELGEVSPVEFIPLAEETGLILPIGEWVLREACHQIKAWHDTGFPKLQVAVNLSGKQLRQRDFPDRVRVILRETELEPRYLDLELTETLLMADTGETAEIMQALHDLGVSFSVDDFGTGYSSLAYLKRFPIDILKIDRSFVRDIASDPNDVAIVKTIIAMAHTLGMRVVAEGVETREQLQFLRAQGCDGSQGYYCSEPLSADTFTELLTDWNRIRAGRCKVASRIKLKQPRRRLRNY